MTWLGKILTVLVFLGALVWAYFTVNTYVLRTNWKVERDRYKVAYDEARARREDDHRRYLAGEDLLRREVAAARTRYEGLSKSVENLSASARKAGNEMAALQDVIDKGDVAGLKLQANLNQLVAELKNVRERNYLLEDNAVKLVVAAEEARGEMVKARNSEKLAQSIAAENAKRVDELQARITQLRESGVTGADAVTRAFEKRPPPVLANLRGEVTDVSGDLVTISIGIDSGLAVGTTLEIYRTAPEARFLGTVKVTDAFNLYPKQAVVKFTPASGLPLARLRPEELPKKGDLIRPVNGGN
jgi:hypothetical protein